MNQLLHDMKQTLNKMALLAALGFGLSYQARAAIYDEVSGLAVVEAEHFHNRENDSASHWHIVPDENGTDELQDEPLAETVWTNARGGKYIQSLPDSPGGGANHNTAGAQDAPPFAEYQIMINNAGAYRLFLRWGGYDGASDSIYAQIVEAKGVNGNPNWARYARLEASRDFNTAGWIGDAGLDRIDGGGGEVPALWNLTPGVYTVRIAMREDGSAVDAIALALNGLGVPSATAPESATTTSFITITASPQGAISTPGTTATFSVAAEGTGTLAYQWQSKGPSDADFTDIAGASTATYTTGQTTEAMNGTQYRVRISNGSKTVFTSAATLVTDATGPRIVGGFAGSDLRTVTLRFSEKVTEATAQTLGNYTINGLAVTAAVLQPNGTDVVLTTAAQTSGTSYTVNINGIKDVAGNAGNNLSTTVQGASRVNGLIDVAIWNGLTGVSVGDLEADPDYPAAPDIRTAWTSFGPYSAGNNLGNDFGAEVTGWIVPPVDGDYKFYLRSDDASRLYLSTTDKREDEVVVAEQLGCCNAFTDAEGSLSSAPVTLQANKPYWIRAMLKEGGGDDYLQVGWRTPNDPDLTVPPTGPIAGHYLQAFADPTAVITITQQPANITAAGSTPATFIVGFDAFSSFGTNAVVQWQTAPAGSSTFTDIAGATAGSFTIPFADPSQSGVQYRARITASGTSIFSDVATLNVSSETVPPTLASVIPTPDTITLVFSEPVDQASASALANYSLNNGATIQSAQVTSTAGQAGTVVLNVNGVVSGNTYTLTLNGVKDLSNNTIASNTTRTFKIYDLFENFDTGTIGAQGSLRGSAVVRATGGYLNTGHGELTRNIGDQTGTIVFEDVTEGADVTEFTATFKLFIGNGSANAADGFSFSLGNGLPTGTIAEEGAGNGIVVAFDTYDNGGGEAPAIEAKYGNVLIGTGTKVPKATLVNNQWVDVFIQVDSQGRLTVMHNNVKYYDQEPIPDWIPINAPQVAFGARTGGENASHLIDNVGLIYNQAQPVPQPPTIIITSPASGTVLNAGASGAVTVNAQSTAGIAKVEFFANGQKLGESTTAPYSFTIPAVPAGMFAVTATVTDINGVAVTSAPISVIARPAASAADVLFVHGGTAPNAGDLVVINRLFNKGYDVYTVGDAASAATDANSKTLVIVSSTVGSTAVNTKFLDTTVPVIQWENALQDDFLFTENTDGTTRGVTGNQTQLEIATANHPLAAGLSGTVTVATGPAEFSWGVPAASAIKVGKLVGVDRYAIYAYDKGAQLITGAAATAAGRRVHFMLTDATATLLNENGIKLFDAAVAWATDSDTTVNPATITITRNGTEINISWTNGGVLEATDSLTNPNWAQVDDATPYSTTATGTMRFFRVKN